ncbi:probable tubulin polyglutamylase TTLL9 [Copidosoma floridanum]|uniref:probable tubulin polyglutamylase TTLL9 n=1 Tax=Copidosoma floridanum TaxID=29053 RepID=UPI000C6F5916|nr:probable tubulin polyglutamylase TTLL9 [Copidosoma floridanum]
MDKRKQKKKCTETSAQPDEMSKGSPPTAICKKTRNSRKSKIKFRCDYSPTPLKVLQARGWTRVQEPKDNSWDIWWCDTSELKLALDGPVKLEANQRVSHFRNHCELTRKNYLYRNLRRYRRLLVKANKSREAELCNAMPMSFELPAEYRMLVEEHRRCQGTTWIVKPAGGSQGRGIFLFQRLKDLTEWRTKECVMMPDASDLDTVPAVPVATYVVQKYIDNPYLLEGRKFDLRIYVLVTSFQPLKVWLAREGFARLSSEQFSLERIDERRVHLTNMSIQLKTEARKSEGERVQSLGRKLPLNWLRSHLTARHGRELVQRLLRNIAGIIMASLQSVQSVIIPSKNSFELYGYDVLLDANLRPWLLEINASPSLNATDPDDFRLKFDLIDDLLSVLDLERLLTGRETRVGGFDLLWDDAPVWSADQPRELNIFLGADNDRADQLKRLRERLGVTKVPGGGG